MTEQHTQMRSCHALGIETSDINSLQRITPGYVPSVYSVVLIFRGSQSFSRPRVQERGIQG